MLLADHRLGQASDRHEAHGRVSFAGFAWWLLMYRSTEGSTIKATYMVQVFPFLALLGGQAAQALVQRNRRWIWILGTALGVSALWILPLCFSRFT